MEKLVLGKKIRDARLEKKYTQQRLAKDAGIGEMYLGECRFVSLRDCPEPLPMLPPPGLATQGYHTYSCKAIHTNGQ